MGTWIVLFVLRRNWKIAEHWEMVWAVVIFHIPLQIQWLSDQATVTGVRYNSVYQRKRTDSTGNHHQWSSQAILTLRYVCMFCRWQCWLEQTNPYQTWHSSMVEMWDLPSSWWMTSWILYRHQLPWASQQQLILSLDLLQLLFCLLANG